LRIRMFLDHPDPDTKVRSSDPAQDGFGSGSESFYHQTKIVRKTLIPTVS
jgi:hypothetical protein